jgi:hypothetical protein
MVGSKGLASRYYSCPTSQSKGRTARWRFWSPVFYQGSAASFGFR